MRLPALLVSSAGAAWLLQAACVHAQPAYPVKAVRIVIPYLPGGGNDVIGRLNAEVTAGLTSAEVRDRLASQGYEPEASTPQQLADHIRSERARYGKLIKAIGFREE